MDEKNISEQLPLLEHKAQGRGGVTNGPGTEEFPRTGTVPGKLGRLVTPAGRGKRCGWSVSKGLSQKAL